MIIHRVPDWLKTRTIKVFDRNCQKLSEGSQIYDLWLLNCFAFLQSFYAGLIPIHPWRSTSKYGWGKIIPNFPSLIEFLPASGTDFFNQMKNNLFNVWFSLFVNTLISHVYCFLGGLKCPGLIFKHTCKFNVKRDLQRRLFFTTTHIWCVTLVEIYNTCNWCATWI